MKRLIKYLGPASARQFWTEIASCAPRQNPDRFDWIGTTDKIEFDDDRFAWIETTDSDS